MSRMINPLNLSFTGNYYFLPYKINVLYVQSMKLFDNLRKFVFGSQGWVVYSSAVSCVIAFLLYNRITPIIEEFERRSKTKNARK